MKKKNEITIKGEKDELKINSEDSIALKIAMLVEGTTTDMTKKELAAKYGYTREHYYHLKKIFEESGSSGLIDKKPGPTKNTKRIDVVNNQIIRLRFLDPDSSSGVIGQKLRQMGFSISDRSVARTIAELGLQKKTSQIKSSKRASKTD